MRIDVDPRGGAAACAHERRFQPEIQGLRAVSVLAVIGAHAALPGVGGGFTGVDVFFVISGFLITRLLLAEIERTGGIDLGAFWVRRARRLLPNAFAALLGTALLAVLLFPGYDPVKLAREIAFAALEVANFHFAEQAVDYFGSDGPASPVLHFWSLNVEEQFYILWPLLLLGVALRYRGRVKRPALLVLGLVWCASFAASVSLTYAEQPLAYFSTFTRAWQLATGALLAAGWQSLASVPRAWRVALAWLGAVAIVAAVILADGADYPGVFALVPTLGAAALIAGIEAAAPRGLLRRGLNHAAMQWIGARSYSWYLWHWPLLALPRVLHPDSPYIAVLAVPASLALAFAAHRWIEEPARRGYILPTSAPWPTLGAAAAAMALVVSAAYAATPALAYLHPEIAQRSALIRTAKHEKHGLDRKTCHLNKRETDQPDCLFGDVAGKRRAVLFGDSHAFQWLAPLREAATQTGWRLYSWTKSACPSADVRLSHGGPYAACDAWREAIMARLTGSERPDLVILSNSTRDLDRLYDPVLKAQVDPSQAPAVWREGLHRTIERLLAAGLRVVLIRDTPAADPDYGRCLMRSPDCAAPRDRAIAAPSLDIELARAFAGGVSIVDLTDAICGPSDCPVMRDGQIIYRDATHLADGFMVRLAPQMAAMLAVERSRFEAPLPQASFTGVESGLLEMGMGD